MVLGIVGAALPAVTFSFARKVMKEHDHLAGAAIGGAVVVSIFGLLIGSVLILAVVGWLPPLGELIH